MDFYDFFREVEVRRRVPLLKSDMNGLMDFSEVVKFKGKCRVDFLGAEKRRSGDGWIFKLKGGDGCLS